MFWYEDFLKKKLFLVDNFRMVVDERTVLTGGTMRSVDIVFQKVHRK
jgi:hypothetical protein